MSRSQIQQLAALRAHVTMNDRAIRKSRSLRRKLALAAKNVALVAIIESIA